jgi:hypothetical protein
MNSTNRSKSLSILSALAGSAFLLAATVLAIPSGQKGTSGGAPAAAGAGAPGGSRAGTTDNAAMNPNGGQKLTASAIQIQPVDPPQGGDLLIPEDFRIATYEYVIEEVTKTKKFKHVYRAGDTAAAGEKDLVILRLVPEAFKEGSQKKREVTTVSGATSLKMKVVFTSPDGKPLMARDLEGKVRFYGENLRATYDLAKKVANVVDDTF